jgi:hypothetical protein
MKTLVQNSGLIALAAFTAFAITAVGQGLWGVMAIVNVAVSPAIPWAAPVMALERVGFRRLHSLSSAGSWHIRWVSRCREAWRRR